MFGTARQIRRLPTHLTENKSMVIFVHRHFRQLGYSDIKLVILNRSSLHFHFQTFQRQGLSLPFQFWVHSPPLRSIYINRPTSLFKPQPGHRDMVEAHLAKKVCFCAADALDMLQMRTQH